MTTEERAYKYSLSRAKAVLNGPFGEQCKDAIIQIFPKLAESEDERIRKELISFIKAISLPNHIFQLSEKKALIALFQEW